MMRKFILMALAVTTFTLSGCMKIKDAYEMSIADAKDAADAFDHAQGIFGSIDPKQDWNSITNGRITITADADLNDIVKVQILTESPFRNADAKLLSEASVQKGQSVTLVYDAPNINKRLIAACVDSKGRYYIKGFNIGTGTLSFQPAATRSTDGARRAEAVAYPDANKLKLEFSNAVYSYNALRTRLADMAASSADADLKNWVQANHIDLWTGKKWEEEMLWQATNTNNTGTEWTVSNGTVLRTIANITSEESEALQDIFNKNLYRKDPSGWDKRKDNLQIIRESEVVKLYNNHLTSNGTTPVTVIPVQTASTEMASCHLYYYYYKTTDIPAGMTEADYIKRLPKFKAIQCWATMSAAGIPNSGSEQFFKKHEYLLPYYGDNALFANQPATTAGLYTTDGKVYRIRNGHQYGGQDYYMTFLPTNQYNKLATRYADNAANVENQLWQVFTDASGCKTLYNIGAGQFMTWSGYWDTNWTTELSSITAGRYTFDDDHHIWRWNNKGQKGLGCEAAEDKRSIASDKSADTGDLATWFMEEYTGSKTVNAREAVTLEQHTASVTSPAITIPQGYRIGFVLRKLKGAQDWNNNNIVKANNNGCCYGFGGLNSEINNFPGHFISSAEHFTMEDDDPRAAYFTANNRTYITFEDGSDAQFSDMIIEVTGTEELKQDIEVEAAAYTMCFEDRPLTADYDLNDVVLRCTRVDNTTLSLALIAAGGNDDAIIHGAEGWELNNQEVHAIFHASTPDENGNRFVNTVVDGTRCEVQARYVEVDPTMTIPEYLKGIYIENRTTGKTIRYAQAGDPPFAIIVPEDFQYPMENQSITKVYVDFINWAQNVNASGDWYKYEDANLIFPSLFKNW